VRVGHGGGGLGLAEKPLARRGVGRELRTHDLDGHNAVELEVVGPQDHAHPAVADDVDHLVRADLAQPARDVARLQEVQRNRIGIGLVRRIVGRRLIASQVVDRVQAQRLLIGQDGAFEEIAGVGVGLEQGIDAPT